MSYLDYRGLSITDARKCGIEVHEDISLGQGMELRTCDFFLLTWPVGLRKLYDKINN